MNPHTSSKKRGTPSVPSELFKRSTTRIIRKTESKVPYYFQSYTDFYKEYLHALDDYFAMCYLLEHKLFENRIQHKAVRMERLDTLIWRVTNMAISQIETTANVHSLFAQTQISWIRTFDRCVHLMFDYFKSTNSTPSRSHKTHKR